MAQGEAKHDQPRLYVHLASDAPANSPAVVICPGGGYWMLAMQHEGHDVARWFNQRGVHAFVLQYRLGQHAYRHPVMLGDAQRAIRMVRAHAKEWKLDPERLGIMGFSAGGHLASTASTHFDAGRKDAQDPVERYSSRPTFSVLAYPVISLNEAWTHRGSRKNLLGADPDPTLVAQLSSEHQVSSLTPPTFLVHTDADNAVPPENSVMYYLALRKAGVPAEMHIYQKGRHGLGMAPDNPVFSTWMDRLADWLKGQGIIH